MKNLPTLKIKDACREVILVQGGMGIGISLAKLARAVAKRGAIGTVASVGLDVLVSRHSGKKVNTREATAIEIAEAKADGGFIALNCMVACQKAFTDSILGAIEGGVDAIILGAGLPTTLPPGVEKADIALIPIVSSAKALRIIYKRWAERYDRVPDAAIVEGPLAGGHLGFSFSDLDKDKNRLENIFQPIKDFALTHGNFPVIVAGGIYYHQDIVRWINEMGADGVQMGTRFAATYESGASDDFKQAIINCREDDIIIAQKPGSPCGFPFRIIKSSPGYLTALEHTRAPRCNRGFVLKKDDEGKFTVCTAKDSCDDFCICNVLLSAHGFTDNGEEPIYTIGQRAHLVDKILSVDELMDELIGLKAVED